MKRLGEGGRGGGGGTLLTMASMTGAFSRSTRSPLLLPAPLPAVLPDLHLRAPHLAPPHRRETRVLGNCPIHKIGPLFV